MMRKYSQTKICKGLIGACLIVTLNYLLLSSIIYFCQNVAKDIFCKDKLKVTLWAQLNPKLDWAAIEEPPLALLWFAKYADYQMNLLKLFKLMQNHNF